MVKPNQTGIWVDVELCDTEQIRRQDRQMLTNSRHSCRQAQAVVQRMFRTPSKKNPRQSASIRVVATVKARGEFRFYYHFTLPFPYHKPPTILQYSSQKISSVVPKCWSFYQAEMELLEIGLLVWANGTERVQNRKLPENDR